MPHWLTPVWDDHSVRQPSRRWLSTSSQRCNVGTSPDANATRSTGSDSPSTCTNTTPGTSVVVAPRRRRDWRAMRWSYQESSSRASAVANNVPTTVATIVTSNAAQNPSSRTPGSSFSTTQVRAALTARLAAPSVYTDSGTNTKANAGQTTELKNPTTRPAKRASRNRSISKPDTSHDVMSKATATTRVTERVLPMT